MELLKNSSIAKYWNRQLPGFAAKLSSLLPGEDEVQKNLQLQLLAEIRESEIQKDAKKIEDARFKEYPFYLVSLQRMKAKTQQDLPAILQGIESLAKAGFIEQVTEENLRKVLVAKGFPVAAKERLNPFCRLGQAYFDSVLQ